MRVHWLLYHPQALDDANKGIVDELKKTNYRDIFKKKEKGESLERPRQRSERSLCVLSVGPVRAQQLVPPGALPTSILTPVPAAPQPPAGAGEGGDPARCGLRSEPIVCPGSPFLYFSN